MSSLFDRFVKPFLKKLLSPSEKKEQNSKSDDRKNAPKPPGTTSPQPATPAAEKNHPWRLCPIGESWVREHPLTIPAHGNSPERLTTRRGHCRKNPGGSEVYTAAELQEIASAHFTDIAEDPEAMPAPDALGFPQGNDYDLLIAGWTKFWNEILNPTLPLTPDLVKALIATESSFKLKPDPVDGSRAKDTPSKAGSARGLIQLTEQTRRIMRDAKGELKGHFVDLSIEESREASANIGAGIRWLHHKRKLATRRLKREATWEEAIWEYKGITKQIGKVPKANGIVGRLKGFHETLREHRASDAASRESPGG